MTYFKKVLIYTLCLFISYKTVGQNSPTLTARDSLAPILTADSLASGNYKDIFSSFYQLALNNLTGPNKELKFTSNPYAILLKNNPDLADDVKYQKYKYWRKLNFTVDAKLDSAYHFNGFSIGFNYALVNNRDITIKKVFTNQYFANIKSDFQLHILQLATDSAIRKLTVTDTTLVGKLTRQLDSLYTYSYYSYSSMGAFLLTRMARVAADSALTGLYKNRRLDTTIKIYYAQKTDSATYRKLRQGTQAYIDILPTLTLREKMHLEFQNAFYKDSTMTFDKLDPQLQNLLKQIAAVYQLNIVIDSLNTNPALNLYKQKNNGFLNLRNKFQTRCLWTVGVSDTTYATGNFFKILQLSTEWLRGLPWNLNQSITFEWDLKGSLNFSDDTLRPRVNLLRQYWNVQPGINMAIRNKSQLSFFEFKISGGFNYVFMGTYDNEKRLDVTLNGDLRLKVFDNFWIPLQIKYDPKTGNVFGFLNITTNFTGLGSLLKSGSARK